MSEIALRHRRRQLRGVRVAVAFLLAAATFTAFTPPAHAAIFAVDSTVDTTDANPGDGVCDDGAGRCTLRAAIQEANAGAGADTITLPAGTYGLTLSGFFENNSRSGDLDIRSTITINGSGASTTTIDQTQLDRVIDVRSGGSLTMSRVTVEGGRAFTGAGIRVTNGTLRLTSVELVGNRASSGGGFRANDSTVVLNRVTATGNTASSHGGGGYASDSTVTATNSTLSGNSAGSRGGGLRHRRGSLTLSFVTITGNSAPEGAGLAWNGPISTNVANTIVANNGSENCDDSFTSGGHNLDSGTSCGFNAAGDLSSTNPMFGALAYNGGATRSHALLAGSPAIDAASTSCAPSIDQRGTVRPQDGDAVPGAVCDIGSYEYETGVLAQAPVLDPIGPQSGDELTLITFTATATDGDAGDVLTFSLEDGPGAVPTGAVIGGANGVFTWTPTAAQGPASYTFDVVVADDAVPSLSDRETITVTVTQPNLPPVITGPGVQTDAEGDAVSVFVPATDPDLPGTTLTWSATGLPSGLSIDPATGEISGSLDYTAATGSPHSVEVTVTDDGVPPLEDSTSFLWFVSNTNRPPTITSPGAQTNGENDTVTLNLGGNDPDGGTLTWSATGLPAGLDIDPATGAITGVIGWTAADASPYTVVVDLVDDDPSQLGDQISFSWSVTDTNRAPQIVDPGDQQDSEGGSVDLSLSATDPDGGATIVWSATGLPPGLSIDPATGEITGGLGYTAGNGSPYRVDITATDDGIPALSDTVSFDWEVAQTNRSPILSKIGDHVGDELTLISFTATASDLDGDELRFSLVDGNGAVPSGATIDPVTGVFTWTPTADQGPAVYSFVVVVTDDAASALDDREKIAINVIEPNLPPVAAFDAVTLEEDGGAVFDVLANDTDPETDRLDIVRIDLPRHGKLSELDDGVFSYRPNANWHGTERLTYAISDGRNPSVHQTIEIVVTGLNDAPTARDSEHSLDAGDITVIDFGELIGDVDGDALTLELTSEPEGAELQWLEPQLLELTTKVGYDGETAFGYEVSDGNGGTAAAQITLSVMGPTNDLGVPGFVSAPPPTPFTPMDEPAPAPPALNFTGMRLVVGSVYQTFSLFRLPGLVFAGVFGLSLLLGVRREMTLHDGAVYLPPGKPGKMVTILLGADRSLIARAEPGDHSDVVHRFPARSRDLAATGRRAQLGSQTWVELSTPHGDAWVHGTYVSDQVTHAAFVADRRPRELVQQLAETMGAEGSLRSLTVEQGLYLAHHAPPELISSNELDGILCDSVGRTWWDSTGGTPMITGTFADVEPSAAIPPRIANLPSLGVAHPNVPGKDAWRIFFEYSDDEPRVFAIWKDAPTNPMAHSDIR
jgi:CSLREA domain-containing protein